MPSRSPSIRSGAVRLSAVLMLGSALAPLAAPAALAQPLAASASVRSFAIRSEPLVDAMQEFSRITGIQVAYTAAIGSGVASPGASGSLSPGEALSRLLTGTGLTYRFTGSNAVTLEPAPRTSGAIQLGPVRIEGQTAQASGDVGSVESPRGPDVGYAATAQVVATKTPAKIIDTPQAISVVTRQQMDDQDVQSVPEALRYTSGVLAEQRGVSENGLEYLYGRGFLIDTFLDGLRLPSGNTGTTGYNVVSVDPYFLQSIQVLHGPASVLYGQASPGGIVDLLSKLPTAQPYHEVELQTGSYGRAEGAFDFGGPIDQKGQVLYRLTGIAYDTGTQVDHVRNERLAIAPALTWKPDANTSLTLLANYQDDPEAGFYNFVPAQGTVLANPNGKIPRSFDPGDPNFDRHTRTQASIGYLFEHRFNHVFTVRQNLRYLSIDDDYRNAFGNGVSTDESMLKRYAFINDEDLDYLTLDNQVQADVNTGPLHHTVLVGLDYAHTTGTESYGVGAAPNLSIFAPVYGASIAVPAFSGIEHFAQDRTGLYFQDQITLDRLHILVGGRQDWYGASDREQISNTLQTQNDHPFTWRAGAVYEFDMGLAPYFSYATSFQPDESTSYTGALLQPTTAQQYEAGLKYQPPGVNAFVTVSAFNLTEQNVATTDPDHPTFSIDTGEIRSRGIELEGHASLTNNLDLIASYTYDDALVTKSNTTNLNKVPTGIPRNMASLWANYRLPAALAPGLQLGAGVRYVDSSWGTTTNTFQTGAYTLVDAALQYDLAALTPALKGVQASINVTNLFDTRYVASCTSLSNCNLGLGRMVLGKVAYRW